MVELDWLVDMQRPRHQRLAAVTARHRHHDLKRPAPPDSSGHSSSILIPPLGAPPRPRAGPRRLAASAGDSRTDHHLQMVHACDGFEDHRSIV